MFMLPVYPFSDQVFCACFTICLGSALLLYSTPSSYTLDRQIVLRYTNFSQSNQVKKSCDTLEPVMLLDFLLGVASLSQIFLWDQVLVRPGVGVRGLC